MADTQNHIDDPLGFFEPQAEGWNATQPGMTEAQKDEFERAEQDMHDLNVAIHKTFSTPTGKRVLQWLHEAVMKQPTWCASLGMEKGVAHGFAREGQMSVYREIEDRMKAATAQKKTNQKGK